MDFGQRIAKLFNNLISQQTNEHLKSIENVEALVKNIEHDLPQIIQFFRPIHHPTSSYGSSNPSGASSSLKMEGGSNDAISKLSSDLS